jgi:hypothetical protein
MCIECSLDIHWTFPECALNVPWIFTECSLNVHWMFSGYSLRVPWMSTEWALNVPWLIENRISNLSPRLHSTHVPQTPQTRNLKTARYWIFFWVAVSLSALNKKHPITCKYCVACLRKYLTPELSPSQSTPNLKRVHREHSSHFRKLASFV